MKIKFYHPVEFVAFLWIIFSICIFAFGCNEEKDVHASSDNEWQFSKNPNSLIGNEHVVTISGHGRTCYVFVEDMNARNAAALLWCEQK